MSKIAVLGGSGCIGKALVCTIKKFGSYDEVIVIDKVPLSIIGPKITNFEIDIFHSEMKAKLLRILNDVQTLVLALNFEIAIKFLECFGNQINKKLVLIDTLSAKYNYLKTLEKINNSNIISCSINPMFRPHQEVLGDGNVAIIEYSEEQLIEKFLQMLQKANCKLVVVSESVYHECVNCLQALVHASTLIFGLTLNEFEPNMELLLQIATPQFTALYGILKRILLGTSEVYYEIQKENIEQSRLYKVLNKKTAVLFEVIQNRRKDDFVKIWDLLMNSFNME